MENGDNAALRQLCLQLDARVRAFLEEEPSSELVKSTQKQTRISLGVIEEALQKYSRLDELSISYNGGKDCLVLLILFLSVLGRTYQPLPERIQSVYIVARNSFAEVEDFVNKTMQTYSLDLMRYVQPMKASFELYLRDRPNVKAIFVGTRRTDPHGADLTHFDRTDHGWPDFMRIHPVIDWHYAEIWTFIRHNNIPYCSLYDMGYTSLGGTTDTHPNPKLRQNAGDGAVDENRQVFRPAYELMEDEAERLGRDG